MTATPCGFCWYELMTTDTKGAAAFYGKVTGWSANDSGMTDRAYTILSAGPNPVAGMMPLPDELRATGMPPFWMGYIAVPDVDDYAKRLQAAGGTLHRPPEDIPGVGRFSVAGDPHNAGFILFKGMGDAPPAVAPGTAGHVGWHELQAGNLDAAWEFYSRMFGWVKSDAVDMGPMGVYQTFGTGGTAFGGMMTKTAEVPMPFWLYYFNVEAIDDAVARVGSGGGKVINGPMAVPGGSWIVQCLDPQGAMFALVANRR